MGSSNRHWPNMFKAKPCSPDQWQRDISSSLISSGSHRSPHTSVGRREEIRTPEPKLRWNPKPEQIRILEDIFNSGMVNPPRDEITNITAQLQQYGEVGDANIFYWFQNRKSRSKHKLRSLQNSKNNQNPQTQNTCSSSQKSVSPNDHQILITTETALLCSMTYVGLNEITPPAAEPFWFPMHDHNGGGVDDDITQRFFFSDLSNGIQDGQAKLPTEQPHHLLSEIMYHGSASKKEQEVEKAMKMQPSRLSFSMASIPTTHTDTLIQGAGEQNAVSPVIPAKSTVVIHGVAYEMPVGPLNLREAFGDGAVLMDASGQPVPTNGWGVTLHSLQPGAFYYLI